MSRKIGIGVFFSQIESKTPATHKVIKYQNVQSSGQSLTYDGNF